MTCVVVAGTKGKGSTAAFLASVLHHAGIPAGLYTSPHLQSWRERIRVDGVAIGPLAFARSTRGAVELARRLRGQRPGLGEPSAFELLTVAALTFFARKRCAIAILEVGLGGRFDATNAVDPLVSIVAPIGLDHRQILGPSLARIAREKAGVLRPDLPGLIARQRPEAERAIARICRDVGARCVTVPPVARTVRLGLAGDHQRQNAALARAAALELRARGHAIPDRAIASGLRTARWPGRLERAGRAPEILLDAAHTPGSTSALATELRLRRGRLRVVFGCTADRDPRVIARPLVTAGALIYATASSGPRAIRADLVAGALGRSVAGVGQTVVDALAGARADAARTDTICVTGSVALVGEARTALGLPVPERLFE
jgi:dihydrofolate synthase / folylpolyglutamate synthase